jgi:hypothetical protein
MLAARVEQKNGETHEAMGTLSMRQQRDSGRNLGPIERPTRPAQLCLAVIGLNRKLRLAFMLGMHQTPGGDTAGGLKQLLVQRLPLSGDHGQKLRCTRNMTVHTFSSLSV